jgi:hypothetical protein
MKQPPRWEILQRVALDVSLSLAARTLYMILDRRAGQEGEIFDRQQTLIAILGKSPRTFASALAQLKAKYVRVEKGNVGSRYMLSWHPGFAASCKTSPLGFAASCKTVLQPVAKPSLCIKQIGIQNVRTTLCPRCFEYHEGEETLRCRCGNVYDPQDYLPLDWDESAGRLLSGFIEHVGLPWSDPDIQIIRASLEAAGGLAPLYHALRKLAHDRQAPKKSYAWFPVVIKQMIGGEKTA